MSPEASAAMVCGPLRILITSTFRPCFRQAVRRLIHMIAMFSPNAPSAIRTGGSSAPSVVRNISSVQTEAQATAGVDFDSDSYRKPPAVRTISKASEAVK